MIALADPAVAPWDAHVDWPLMEEQAVTDPSAQFEEQALPFMDQ
ncbi:MAG: polymerase subunit sigma, partial [Microbacterium sp.]|nr:polymerase subunit sigma [Microbacterium sp.]